MAEYGSCRFPLTIKCLPISCEVWTKLKIEKTYKIGGLLELTVDCVIIAIKPIAVLPVI